MRIAIVLLALITTVFSLRAEPDVVRLGPFGGDVRSLASHPSRPQKVFLGTSDGQIFASLDGGERWEKLLPGLGRRDLVVDSLVFHPQDPDILYAAGWELKNDQGRLYRTRDGGQSWENISLGRYQSSVRAVAIAPTNPDVLAVGISEGVLLSLDGGRRWDRITRGYRSLYNVHSLAFDPLDFNTLFVGTWRLAWKTHNLGKKWEPIHKGMYWDSDLFTLLIDPRDTQKVFASACSGVYRSLNQGEKWAKLKNGLPDDAKRTRTLRFHPADFNTLYAGTTIGLFRSLDGGERWEKLLSDVVVNAVTIISGETDTILVGTDDAGVLKSTDGGKTFQASNHGFTHRQIGALAVDPAHSSRIYAAVSKDRHYGGFLLSEDGGRSWDTFNDGLGAAVSRIQAILPSSSSSRLFLATSEGLFFGNPEREEWTRFSNTEGLAVLDLEFAGPSQQKLLLAAEKGLFSLDLLEEEPQLRQFDVPGGSVTSLVRIPHSGALFAAGSEGVFRSVDEGRMWQKKAAGLPPGPCNALAVSASRLFCGTRSGLYFSENEGKTWQQAEGVFPIEISAVAAGSTDSGMIFAADLLVGYLFVSGDGGNTWRNFDLGTELSGVAVLRTTADGDLLAGTLSEGVCRIAADRALASLKEDLAAAR